MSVHLSVNEGMAKILLDHPPYNLLSNQVKREVTEAFKEVSKNESIRVILFEAIGDHFCCGADLKEFHERISTKDAPNVWDCGHEMLASIMEAPQSTVSCIFGNALGAGAELASAFDIRIFDQHVNFGYPEVLRGVFPGNGGLERLVDLVGAGKAMSLLLSGKTVSAEAAFQMGLATEISTPAKGKERTEEYAQMLCSRPGVALKTIKNAIKKYEKEKERFFNAGREMFACVHETEDVKEAVTAFLEKRKPVYQHR
ncbi:enoyl-CoA hydratase/isomerase family protein [Aneurinibacillus terranovensis]|uniref:enoyl-CoA hydratase/isomerase family protein n=1 Tax=Aneurinibacillus terranovensis TaxID=278991 RepID=UPI0004803FD0|nr:enoyl-CoA hydratase/isomerase family protein [Aneurinibacillus terranovensis]